MFTEKELTESIEELAKLEEEIQKLDAIYNENRKAIPQDITSTKLSAEDSSVIDKLMAEAKRKAEQEGRARAALYRDNHEMIDEPKPRSSGRRGLIV